MVGRIGRLPSGTTLENFAKRVRETLGELALRVAGDPARRVEQIAVVPGAGAEFLTEAMRSGADAMVTGDVSHHRVREALDRGLCVLDPGHAPTERPGLKRLQKLLEALEPECLSLLDLDPDPWSS